MSCEHGQTACYHCGQCGYCLAMLRSERDRLTSALAASESREARMREALQAADALLAALDARLSPMGMVEFSTERRAYREARYALSASPATSPAPSASTQHVGPGTRVEPVQTEQVAHPEGDSTAADGGTRVGQVEVDNAHIPSIVGPGVTRKGKDLVAHTPFGKIPVVKVAPTPTGAEAPQSRAESTWAKYKAGKTITFDELKRRVRREPTTTGAEEPTREVQDVGRAEVERRIRDPLPLRVPGESGAIPSSEEIRAACAEAARTGKPVRIGNGILSIPNDDRPIEGEEPDGLTRMREVVDLSGLTESQRERIQAIATEGTDRVVRVHVREVRRRPFVLDEDDDPPAPETLGEGLTAELLDRIATALEVAHSVWPASRGSTELGELHEIVRALADKARKP